MTLGEVNRQSYKNERGKSGKTKRQPEIRESESEVWSSDLVPKAS